MLLGGLPVAAQFRVAPLSDEAGQVGLGLLLRRLGTVGVFMMATAHPDDENNSLLARYGHGLGYRTVLATATRGDGGQNEIGPELSDALAVLRTQELEAVHRFDGAEQYFTRAIDFGFSFSVEETFDKWGKDEIVGDYVRLIRTVRPSMAHCSGRQWRRPAPSSISVAQTRGVRAAGDLHGSRKKLRRAATWRHGSILQRRGDWGGTGRPASTPEEDSARGHFGVRHDPGRTYGRSAPRHAACTSAGNGATTPDPGPRPRDIVCRTHEIKGRWETRNVVSLASTQVSMLSFSQEGASHAGPGRWPAG